VGFGVQHHPVAACCLLNQGAKKSIISLRQWIPWALFAQKKNLVEICLSFSPKAAVKKLDKDLVKVV
jgi:hypothetical protein